MSGLIKGIGKVFKKIGKFVKKNWKYIALAVAVYFTAGIALSYFGATAGFSAAMPGFGTGGIFTSAASAIGFNGPAIAGAATEMAAAAAAGGAAAMSSAEAMAAFSAAAEGAGMTSAQLAAAHAAGEVALTGMTEAGAYTLHVGTAAGEVGGGTAVAASSEAVKEGVFMAGDGTLVNAAGKPIADAAAREGLAQTTLNAGVQSPTNYAEGMTGNMLGGSGGAGAQQGSLSVAEKMMLKNMNTTQKLGIATTLLGTASGLLQKDGSYTPIAFGVGRKGDAKYAWDQVADNSFQNMNKRGKMPSGSEYSKEGGGSSFLKNPFDTGDSGTYEGEYDPQAAKDFIANTA